LPQLLPLRVLCVEEKVVFCLAVVVVGVENKAEGREPWQRTWQADLLPDV